MFQNLNKIYELSTNNQRHRQPAKPHHCSERESNTLYKSKLIIVMLFAFVTLLLPLISEAQICNVNGAWLGGTITTNTTRSGTYVQGQSSNFEVMAQIDSLIGDTTIGLPAAYAAVNTFNPVNQIEQNFKDYYLYYLGYTTCGALSSADSMALYQLASSCPDIQGTAVFRALALYHSLNPDDMITMNNCDRNIETEDRGERKRNIKNKNSKIEIYPNPSNGSFEIIVPDESATYLISIVNYVGQQVYTTQSINSSIINMKTDLPSGVYMITIKNKTTNDNTTQKIVVE